MSALPDSTNAPARPDTRRPTVSAQEPISWDEYAAEHAITEQEAPQAFASYLHEVSERRWDGDGERIDDDPPAGQSPALS